MPNTPVFVMVALALVACSRRSARDARAMAAIERLHEQDRAATISGDAEALRALWTSEAYIGEPGAPPDIGLAAIHAEDARYSATRARGSGIVAYQATVTDIQIHGDIAVERGFFVATFRRAPGEPPIAVRANLLRVLRRQHDGSWR